MSETSWGVRFMGRPWGKSGGAEGSLAPPAHSYTLPPTHVPPALRPPPGRRLQPRLGGGRPAAQAPGGEGLAGGAGVPADDRRGAPLRRLDGAGGHVLAAAGVLRPRPRLGGAQRRGQPPLSGGDADHADLGHGAAALADACLRLAAGDPPARRAAVPAAY